jgi:hypothetical protein
MVDPLELFSYSAAPICLLTDEYVELGPFVENEANGATATMTANGSGLQWSTIRNIALAWILTLPAAMMISGFLYFVFSRML